MVYWYNLAPFSVSGVFLATLRLSFMLQGSWGQLMWRSSTTWRWAANFWLLVSWLKLCPTTTLPWVRLHTDMQTHITWHIYTLTAGWHFGLHLCSTNAVLTLKRAYLPATKPSLFGADKKYGVLIFFQRETLRIIWPTTSELLCSWRWESPNRPCRIWPEPFSSSLTSWL